LNEFSVLYLLVWGFHDLGTLAGERTLGRNQTFSDFLIRFPKLKFRCLPPHIPSFKGRGTRKTAGDHSLFWQEGQ
jgi:hypothetical protein